MRVPGRSSPRSRCAALALVGVMGLAIGFSAPVAGADPAERAPVRVSPTQMQGLAFAALEAGALGQAEQVAVALLARDPTDSLAFAVLARAERARGNADEARRLAALAWRHAASDATRFEAAMARAQALASDDRRTLAMVWLRRAAQNAPSAAHKALAREDFRYVRARNPLALSLGLSVAPVSNINNGSRRSSGTFDVPIFGTVEAELDGRARALSGVETHAAVALRYRLAQPAPGHQTDLHAAVSTRQYRLSDDARARAPDADGRDYAFAQAEIGLAHRGHFGAARPWRLALSFGQSRYGGDAYTRHWDLALRQSWRTDTGLWSLAAGLRRQEALSDRTADADRWRAELRYARPFGDGHRLTLALETERGVSDAAGLDYRGVRVAARIAPGAEIFGTRLEFGIGHGGRQYDRGPVAGRDRRDRDTTLDATAVMVGLEQYGFVPTVSLTARRVDSDFGQFDADEIGLRLGLRSAF